MPKLVRLYIVNVAIGCWLSVVFTGLLLWGNVGNLWHLVQSVSGGWLAVVMLFVANAVVFSGVQFAIAVMRLADSDDDGPNGGPTLPVPLMAMQRPGRGRR
ncbi:MAG: hypothetical protein ACOY4T_01265 [Pseudomonadota bacterium]|jgi:dolichyl-phosphate-mannose--protein O-mannosyl transferase